MSMKSQLLIGALVLVISISFFRTHDLVNSSSADDSVKPRLMTQCLQEFKEFECYAILNFGSYPTKSLIDMRGSPISEILPKMQLPVKTTARGTPPAELQRP